MKEERVVNGAGVERDSPSRSNVRKQVGVKNFKAFAHGTGCRPF